MKQALSGAPAWRWRALVPAVALAVAVLLELCFLWLVAHSRHVSPAVTGIWRIGQHLLHTTPGALLVHVAAALLATAGMRWRIMTAGEPVVGPVPVGDALTAAAGTARAPVTPAVPTPDDEARSWARLALPLALFLPFFGVPLLALLMAWRGRRDVGISRIYEIYREYIDYRVEPLPYYGAVDPDEHALRRLAVEPIVDLLTDHDAATTRGLIEVLSQFAYEDAVGLIRQTLDDPDMDIKFYSSWGLDRIEDRFAADLRAHRAKLASRFTRDGAIALVRTLHEYMLSGLMDPSRLSTHAAECRVVLLRVLMATPGEPLTLALLARTVLVAGEVSEPTEFAAIAQRGLLSPEFMPDYAETLWRAGDLAEAARVMQTFVANPKHAAHLRRRVVDVELASLAEFWGGGIMTRTPLGAAAVGDGAGVRPSEGPLPPVDVELLLEGSYPYVTGGVSTWVHHLITGLPEFTFGLTHIAARRGESLTPRYRLPPNVKFLQMIYLHEPNFMPGEGAPLPDDIPEIVAGIASFHHAMGPQALRQFAPLIQRLRQTGPRHHLRDIFASPEAFALHAELYEKKMPESSFLDSFWTWRFIHLPLIQMLQARLAPARICHAVSTGYAGLLGSLQKVVHGRPLLLTEHGIYTRERAIEITQAQWIHADPYPEHRVRRELGAFKRWWFHFFEVLGSWTYDLADRIVTLFEGNRRTQIGLGANEEKIQVVPNGIDLGRFLDLRPAGPPDPQKFRVGFVGRVVPIKDIKTLVKAAKIVLMKCPDAHFDVVGPLDAEREYVKAVRTLIDELGIGKHFVLHGRAEVHDWYPRLDLSVLTSHSEGQPMTLLEAMAAGIPCVATDVGACRELLEGGSAEDRALGPSGIITSLRSPEQTARAILDICTDPAVHARMVRAGRARVRAFYQEQTVFARYRRLYQHLLNSGASASALPAPPAAALPSEGQD